MLKFDFYYPVMHANSLMFYLTGTRLEMATLDQNSVRAIEVTLKNHPKISMRRWLA